LVLVRVLEPNLSETPAVLWGIVRGQQLVNFYT
jgi:hypothetical protein